MDNVIAARALMGISLGFHIIYATIGIGLPLMLMLAEGLYLRTGDELYHRMARRWIRPAGLLFAIARRGSISVRTPPSRRNPDGVFIQALALMTKTAEAAAATVRGMVQRKSVRGERRLPP